MAENIDFQFPMKKNCSTAIDKFCKNIPHGHARVIRCLQVRPSSVSGENNRRKITYEVPYDARYLSSVAYKYTVYTVVALSIHGG
jgi:hypothetical protein